MSCLTILLSPLNLLFFMIVAGLAIGRIRIKSISVDIAGILFAAIFVGFIMSKLIPYENSEIIVNAQSTLKIFSKLGTALFVSVIGLQTGFSIKKHSKDSMSAFLIGALMSLWSSDADIEASNTTKQKFIFEKASIASSIV